VFQYVVKVDLPVPYVVVTVDEHMLIAVNPGIASVWPDWLQEVMVNDLIRSCVGAVARSSALALALCAPQPPPVVNIQEARAARAAKLAATGTGE
jgi:hypothetical protein